jgi:hypothetical protein
LWRHRKANPANTDAHDTGSFERCSTRGIDVTVTSESRFSTKHAP